MYLLDTDILIYALKGNAIVLDNFQRQSKMPKAISVISYGELIYGAYKSQQVSNNLAKVHRLREIFPIIESSEVVLECFGLLKAELSAQGISVADFDLIIGSTAITLGYGIVTNNEKHFSKIPGLEVSNWMKES